MALPPSVKNAKAGLTKDQQRAFNQELSRDSKSVVMAYVAWLLLGWHYLYLGRVGMQFAFWFTGCFLIVGWFVDFFRIPGMVKKHNDETARRLMTQHKMMA